ncbi:hypothetical protein [Bradyrhizobium sp. ARR65]|uniref:hypothetical protein n=1 Tax=Bradyrhizobium sp. ARR65 TaxID=1040989 RepID=UPI00046336E2|nr:hypothetical protein [Bradyrhizobium sp. ARR65]
MRRADALFLLDIMTRHATNYLERKQREDGATRAEEVCVSANPGTDCAGSTYARVRGRILLVNDGATGVPAFTARRQAIETRTVHADEGFSG